MTIERRVILTRYYKEPIKSLSRLVGFKYNPTIEDLKELGYTIIYENQDYQRRIEGNKRQ